MAFHVSFSLIKSVLFLVVNLCCSLGCSKAKVMCMESERFSLLDFKKSFIPSSSQNVAPLSSWNISSKECCSWDGITCNSSTRHVVKLDLNSYGLESHHLRSSLLKLKRLESLDLSGNNLFMRIPEFIGSFSKLKSLELYESGFFGMIPPQLGNLSSIHTLNLHSNRLFANNFQWLSHLFSLKHLLMGSLNIGEASDFLPTVINLPSLIGFDCELCHFPTDQDSSSTTTHLINSSSSLQYLDLSSSNISPTTISLLMNITHDLSYLDLSGLEFEVGVFKSIGMQCSLRILVAYGSVTKESLVSILQALSPCASRSLEFINFSSMNLTGTLENTNQPYFPALSNLYLDNNNLNGILSDVHFINLSKIIDISFANNPNLTISFNKSLTGLQHVDFSFCNLGPKFPSWLLENNIEELDISHSMISGTIPDMFWMNMSPNFRFLNLSSNGLYGIVPNIPFPVTYDDMFIDLSSNVFSGPIPFFFFMTTGLDLSNNKFSGFAPIPYPFTISSVPKPCFVWDTPAVVDLSSNHLTGPLPHWVVSQASLGALILTNNNLSGTIPKSIGNAAQLFVLSLRNNDFSGPIPSLLKNCSKLRILDLGTNYFSGLIPSWIGENLRNLSVLSLRSNSLTGILPSTVCHLGSLQILDISHNMLHGNIPSCIRDFKAMTSDSNLSQIVYFIGDNGDLNAAPVENLSYYVAYINWKSRIWKFQRNLHLVRLIDLSSNNLSGEIPTELSYLLELDSIDFSCNILQGSIPQNIGELKSLQYLNLSCNRLSGPIPPSLSEISALEMLDLSHNNLSGRIPKGNQLQTFNSSAFGENPQLCGLPLRKCPEDEEDDVKPSPVDDNQNEDECAESRWFYSGMGAGLACGFFGILCTLTWITKWRYAFFQFATSSGKWILLVVSLCYFRISNKFGIK